MCAIRVIISIAMYNVHTHTHTGCKKQIDSDQKEIYL